MILEEVLRQGFALANRRLRLVLLDTVWKAVWLVLTAGLLAAVFVWFSSQLQSIAWQDTGVPALNGLLAARLLQDFWDANKREILWAVTAVLSVAVLLWFLLEGYFRSRILDGPNGMRLYVASGFAKATILAGTIVILGLLADSRGAAIAGLAAFVSLAFLLTLLDTLIRSDAIDLLGTDLIRVSLMLGILMSFELMIAGSIAIAVIAGFLNVGRMIEAVAMLGVAGVALVFLSVFHSYLLLVRFSAISIMRSNAEI